MTVGRILGNDKDMGSAFALATPNSGSTRVVLTANHVVGKHEAASLQFVTQAGRRIPVERVERDDDLDVAVLHLSEDVVEGLAVGRAVEGGSWQVESQPRDNDPKLTGTISATRRRLVTQSGHEIYVLQFQVDQILNDYKGYSGSPVVLKLPTEAVIGVLIEQLRSRLSVPTGQPKPATNVLYAIPIQDVLDRFDLPYVPYVLPDSPSSPPFILPQHDIPFFTGREQELKQLETLLLNTQAQGPRVAAIAGLTGTGGMGKSALACHFATLYRHEFRDGVIGLRVDGAQVDALAQRFADLSSVKIDPERGLSAAEIMQSVFQKRQALLIFDNADDAAMQKLHPGGNTCAVIVTTRNRALLRRPF